MSARHARSPRRRPSAVAPLVLCAVLASAAGLATVTADDATDDDATADDATADDATADDATDEASEAAAAVAVAADTLDLTGFERTFTEDFDEPLSVSPWGEWPSRWIAHTPWNGDFGDARFADPEPGFPFTVEHGVLRIEARRDEDGKWHSGLLAAVDRRGDGFAQDGGYFEARMKVPRGAGTWPAFWLIGTDREKLTAEIDVVEHYGHWPDRYTSARHVWRRGEGEENDSDHSRTHLERGELADEFHTFGVQILDDELVYYLDRRVVWRTPKPEEFDGQEFYPLVNLALGAGWPIDETPDPSYLYVDHVHVWQAPDE